MNGVGMNEAGMNEAGMNEAGMNGQRPRIALVEDDDDLRTSTAQWLTLAGFAVDSFAAAAPALAAIDAHYPGLVVTDVRMPHMSGIEMFRILRARDAELPVLLMTGHGDVAMAVDALKAGAWDFLTKPFDPEALEAAAWRAAKARALALDNRRLRAAAASPDDATLLGEAPAIVRLRAMIPVLAASDIDLLIEGETGTGKAWLARAIHRAGRRSRHRFLTVACAALPGALEDELFSLTGQASLAAAMRGTVLLDDLDMARGDLQARLMPVVEDRVLRQAGRRDALPLDIRIIATASEAQDGGGRAIAPALFHRLAAMRLRLPPLRERREDIGLLFAHLAGQAAAKLRRDVPALKPALREKLRQHDWPGNIRELAHYAERFVLGLDDDAGSLLAGEAPAQLPDAPLAEQVDAFERQAMIAAFVACRGDAGAAMARLGLPRKTFYYKVARHGIDLAQLRAQIAG